MSEGPWGGRARHESRDRSLCSASPCCLGPCPSPREPQRCCCGRGSGTQAGHIRTTTSCCAQTLRQDGRGKGSLVPAAAGILCKDDLTSKLWEPRREIPSEDEANPEANRPETCQDENKFLDPPVPEAGTLHIQSICIPNAHPACFGYFQKDFFAVQLIASSPT